MRIFTSRMKRFASSVVGVMVCPTAAKEEEEDVAVSPPPVESVVEALPFSSPSQTLRLTPLASALRAARARDAVTVLRMYPSLSRSAFALHQDSRGYFGILCIRLILRGVSYA